MRFTAVVPTITWDIWKVETSFVKLIIICYILIFSRSPQNECCVLNLDRLRIHELHWNEIDSIEIRLKLIVAVSQWSKKVPWMSLQVWSDNQQAKKWKTKLLKRWRLLFQYGLLLGGYTWLRIILTSLAHLTNSFGRSLLSTFMWRRRSPHSTRMSAKRLNFLSLETQNSFRTSFENKVDEAAVRIPNRPIWLWQNRRWKPVRFHDWRVFFRQKG